MRSVHWREELEQKSFEETLTAYPWFNLAKSSQSSSVQKKGTLFLGSTRKYTPPAHNTQAQKKKAASKSRAPDGTGLPEYANRLCDGLNQSSSTPKLKLDGIVGSIDQQTERGNCLALERLGELPTDLINLIWGPSRRSTDGQESVDTTAKELVSKLTNFKKKDGGGPECLMDVVLQSWSYFNHSHSKGKKGGSHVHAKYCENAFGHFLLPDGTQVHGSYASSVKKLVTELRLLLARLKPKAIHTNYKVLPPWRPPKLQEIPDFTLPPPKKVPPLYPMEDLLELPHEDIPDSRTPPLLFSPTPAGYPPFRAPALVQAPKLSLPTMCNFSVERKSVEYCLEEELPMPTFIPPEPCPFPVWKEPEQQPFPPEPEFLEMETLPLPIFEPVPTYVPPTGKLRPCEASYYPVLDSQSSVCDGLCGNLKQFGTDDVGRCQAKSLIESQQTDPLPPKIRICEEPLFQPPVEDTVPEFKEPVLIPEPTYVRPELVQVPQWTPPPPPFPIGYLAGQKPVFLVECSMTMAGERLRAVQGAIRHLFSKGGQVEVAATHFDIIMYSFDAWSYGALEEERQYKFEGSARRWMKNVEVMQPKTPANVEKAITWMSKWGTGGRSDLLKALVTAYERHTADCIYLFTDGKPERPVLVMNTLKKLSKERGVSIPVHPIGVGLNKRGVWFMKNMADATGGTFQELDLQWESKLAVTDPVSKQDVELAQSMVSEEQRRTLEAGLPVDMDAVHAKVKNRWLTERHGAQYAMQLHEEERAKKKYGVSLALVKEKNQKLLAEARLRHETHTSAIKEKNKMNYDHAWKLWNEEVQNARALNAEWKKLQDDWENSVSAAEEVRKKTIEEAKMAFQEDLRSIQDSNALKMEHSKRLFDAQVQIVKQNNEKLEKEIKRKQEDIANRVDASNRELWRRFENKCLEIRLENASLLEKAREDFSKVYASVDAKNKQNFEEAQRKFVQSCDEINAENKRRRHENKYKLEKLDVRMKAAASAYEEQVATQVARHNISLADIAEKNAKLEDQAKRDWEETCRRIDDENVRAKEKAVRDWETECYAVVDENLQLEKRRMKLTEEVAEVEAINEQIVLRKKLEWKETCRIIESEYQLEVERKRADHEAYVKEVQRRNEESAESAKLRHSAQVAAVETYNETVRPYIEASKLVQKEIDRINLFLTYLVGKLEIPSLRTSQTSRILTLDERLELLSTKNHSCHSRIIVEGLEVAYADDVKSGKFPERTNCGSSPRAKPRPSTKPRCKFEGMVPISPVRVLGHRCSTNSKQGSEYSTKEFLRNALIRQQEIAVLLSPMVTALG